MNKKPVMKTRGKSREREGITILDLTGRLMMGQEDAMLRQHLLGLLEEGTKELVLNFKAVSAIDSATLGSLVFCAFKFRSAGGKLAFLNLNHRHATLSETLKLNMLFEIYTEELDAINSFFPERTLVRYDILEFVGKRDKICGGCRTPTFAFVA